MKAKPHPNGATGSPHHTGRTHHEANGSTSDGDLSPFGSPFFVDGSLERLHLIKLILGMTTGAEGQLYVTDREGLATLVPLVHLAALEVLCDDLIDLVVEGAVAEACCLECGSPIIVPHHGVPNRGQQRKASSPQPR